MQLDLQLLQQQCPWQAKVHFFEEITSTNDYLLELGEQGAPEGTVAIAGAQTHGRGQFHRSWSAPKGLGLWLSLLLRLPIENATIPSLSQIAPVALCDTLTKLHIEVRHVCIKKPNDLLINKKKVAGVLVETRRGGSSFAVVGIGLNLYQREKDFPLEIRHQATSLALSSSSPIEFQKITTTLLTALHHRYWQLHNCPEELAAEWNARACIDQVNLATL